MKFTLKTPATILALALFPSLGWAQSGQVTGTLDGQPLDFTMSEGIGGMPGLFYETYRYSGLFGVGIIASALEQSGNSIDGVMIFMDLESENASSPRDVTSDMLVDAAIMVVDEWDAGSQNPGRVWLAELDAFQRLEIDQLDLEGDTGAFSGSIMSDSFCLQDMSRGDPEPILQGNAEICKPGTVRFTMTTEAATEMPPAPPMQVDVLGRVTGTIGSDSYDGITFLADGAEATANIERGGAFDMVRIQAHSPESSDFLRSDILTVNFATDPATGEIVTDSNDAVNVSFFPDGIGSHYASDVGDGAVRATVSDFTLDGENGEIALSVEGQFCRVENLVAVEGDCKEFDLEIATEVLRAQAG